MGSLGEGVVPLAGVEAAGLFSESFAFDVAGGGGVGATGGLFSATVVPAGFVFAVLLPAAEESLLLVVDSAAFGDLVAAVSLSSANAGAPQIKKLMDRVNRKERIMYLLAMLSN